MLTLAEASRLTGMNRSSILRAIKRGALTGTKDHNDVWHVDGAELARVFTVTLPNTQPAPQDAHPDALAAYKLGLLEERIAELKERLEEMRQECHRARAGEDAWKAQCEAATRQLALAAPQDAQAVAEPAQADAQPEAPPEAPPARRRWWRRRAG
jgi:TolA-binding protein